MLGFKRVTIAQHERGLVFRNRSFKTILEPGVYWIFNPLKRVEVQVYDLTVTEFEHARVDFLAKRLYDARKSRTQLRHFSKEHPGMTIEDGYAIQREWVKLEIADGHIYVIV